MAPQAVVSSAQPAKIWVVERLSEHVATLVMFVLYAAITVGWIILDVRAIGALLSGDGRLLRHAVDALNSTLTMLFYVAITVIIPIRKPMLRQARGLSGLVLPIVVMFAFVTVGVNEPRHIAAPLTVLATALLILGVSFMLYAIRHLGRHFDLAPNVRGLVTAGPYRFVRHPLYAGEIITLTGVMLRSLTPLAIVAFVIAVSFQLWRARIEERALTTVFPEYADYARVTPMLIPLTARVFMRRASVAITSSAGD